MEIIIRRPTQFNTFVEHVLTPTNDTNEFRSKLIHTLTAAQSLRGTQLYADKDAEIWVDGQKYDKLSKNSDANTIAEGICNKL